MINNMVYEEVIEVVRKHGLHNLDPNAYYPADKFINVFADLINRSNKHMNLVGLGMAVIDNTPLDPEIDNWELEKQLALPVLAYKHKMYKDKLPGDFSLEWISNDHVAYHEALVWPDDFMYGYIYSFAKRFLSKHNTFAVKYDENIDRQDHGGDVTIIHVTWKPR